MENDLYLVPGASLSFDIVKDGNVVNRVKVIHKDNGESFSFTSNDFEDDDYIHEPIEVRCVVEHIKSKKDEFIEKSVAICTVSYIFLQLAALIYIAIKVS